MRGGGGEGCDTEINFKENRWYKCQEVIESALFVELANNTCI